MKKIIIPLLLAAGAFAPAGAQQQSPQGKVPVVEYTPKKIYIPADLRSMDLNDPASKWSYKRMAETENVVLFWAREFGDNITAAPAYVVDSVSHDMNVDLANLLARLEQFYRFYYNDLSFVDPGDTNADKYKMMVMLDYSLEGTAYGGDYDGVIGALWIAPNRVKDPRLNCIAHELGHSFQSQIACDGKGDSWGGSGFFEMASQWMLWRVNPDWPTDENYHLNDFRRLTHKAFLHLDNIYHSPYVLEFWAEKRGDKVIADLFREGKIGEDPAMTYMQKFGLTQKQFNDEMFEASRSFINWDLDYAHANMRKYANQWSTKLIPDGKNRWRVDPANAPENYGFNAIPLAVPAPGKTAVVDFRGITRSKDYNIPYPAEAGWRYGLVAVDKDGKSTYSDVKSSPSGRLTFTVPASGPAIEHLWLVVMGAPSVHRQNQAPWDWDGNPNPDFKGDAQWPYAITLRGTSPL